MQNNTNTEFFVPTVTLRNGLIVANFASPHRISFEDGSVLEACSSKRSKSLLLEKVERTRESTSINGTTIIAVNFHFRITPAIINSLDILHSSGYARVNIVLVSVPVMIAIKEHYQHSKYYFRKRWPKIFTCYQIENPDGKMVSSSIFCA